MSLSQFTYSAADVRRVRRIQFGVLSPEEIVRGVRPAAAPPPPPSHPARRDAHAPHARAAPPRALP
jgi:hypothetical protein